MTEPHPELDPLVRALAGLGVDATSVRALLALPLCEVAWGDGEVQDAERDLIARAAEEQLQVGAEGALLVTDWLRHRPSEAYFARGREVLRTLAGVGTPGFEEPMLAAVSDLAGRVARAAGGFFGLGRVSRAEQDAITRLQKQLADAAVPPAELPVSARDARRDHFTTTLHTVSLAGLSARGVISMAEGPPVPVTREGLRIGSAADCAVVVPLAEPHHCRVFERQRKFYVADESVGGTRLDGERIGERRLLGGETIGLGPAAIVFKMMRKGARPGA